MSIINKIEDFFKTHRWKFVGISIFLVVIFGLLLFDMKLSSGGDDSKYILLAQKFLDAEVFPDWHGCFYPIFLSFFLNIFGLNLFALKFLSFLMVVANVFLVYIAFRKRIPWSILILTMLFSAVCLEIVYFGGQTYSEALYMLLQISAIAAFLKLYDSFDQKPKTNLFKHWKEWLVLGFLIFLLTQTRNIGWSLLLSTVFYFIIEKKIIRLFFIIASFLIFYIPFNIYKSVFWAKSGLGFEAQFEKIFWVNPYDINEGIVSFSDILSRIWQNANIYLSKYLPMLMSWKETVYTNPFLTILIVLLMIFSFFVILKKRKCLSFVTLYVYIAIAVTFITQQVMWDQMRLISIYVPLLLLIFSTALWDFLSGLKINQSVKIIIPIFLIAVLIPTIIKSSKIAYKHFPILKKNIQGNNLYGYTNDWKNYLKIVKWSAENIPDYSKIGCREPGMAFIYSNGRKFEGIYSVKSYKIKQILNGLKSQNEKFNYAFDFKKEGDDFYTLYPFYKDISAIINQTSGKQYIIFSIDKKQNKDFLSILQKTDLTPYNLNYLEDKLSFSMADDYGVYPDTLLNHLSRKKIKYLIAASFRKFPTENTGEFITTIHRYVYFIELKYPGIFNIIWQFGKNNEEPAMILKINYNKIKNN